MFLKDNMVSDTFCTAVSVTQQAQRQPWPIPLFTNDSETSQCTKHILESILTLTNWDIITFRSKRFSSPVSPSTSHMTHTWKLVTAKLTIRIPTLKSQVLQLELVWNYVTTLEKKKKRLAYFITGYVKNFFLKQKNKIIKKERINGHARLRSGLWLSADTVCLVIVLIEHMTIKPGFCRKLKIQGNRMISKKGKY